MKASNYIELLCISEAFRMILKKETLIINLSPFWL